MSVLGGRLSDQLLENAIEVGQGLEPTLKTISQIVALGREQVPKGLKKMKHGIKPFPGNNWSSHVGEN